MIKLMRYEILEHRADLKIRAFGKTKEELFLHALLGMSDSVKAEGFGKKTGRKISIKSLDSTSLLVDFLSEALYLSQTNKEVYFDVKFIKFTDAEIKAELFGQKIERFGEDIKAVTHHDLDIRQRADGMWEATILFDI